jgi:hypothetical protein
VVVDKVRKTKDFSAKKKKKDQRPTRSNYMDAFGVVVLSMSEIGPNTIILYDHVVGLIPCLSVIYRENKEIW